MREKNIENLENIEIWCQNCFKQYLQEMDQTVDNLIFQLQNLENLDQ
jgi:hypothetical protein